MTRTPSIDETQMKRLIPNLGRCTVSNSVVVSDEPIGSMVREEPIRPGDSGWIFTAGTESPAELNEPGNYSLLEVNTVANLAPDIIPFLLYPEGSEVKRDAEGRLVLERGPEEPLPVRLLPAAMPGWLQITQSWGFEVPSLLLRRIEHESQVLWRPGLTLWLDVYVDQEGRSVEERLQQILANVSPDHYARETVRDGDAIRLRYRLDEAVEGGTSQSACYCFVLSERGEMHLACYFETEERLADIETIWSSIRSR